MAEQNPGALSDLRILEITDEKGQYCGKLMADMGADVIKIEPVGGAAERRVGPFVGDVPHPDKSLYFWHYNTNKRGITLNLETPQGQQIFRDLARRADIIVESMKPGHFEGLGIGYDVISKTNPRLIWTSVTSFGQTGPWRDWVTSDMVSMSLGGPMASNGYDHIPESPPSHGLWDNAYETGCNYAFIGTLVALFDRDRTGLGQYIDCSIHEANSGTTEGAFPQWEYNKRVLLRQTGRHHAPTPSLNWQIQCVDGKYAVLMGGLPRTQESWKLLLQWMADKGQAEDLLDEKFADITKFRGFGERSAETDHIQEVVMKFMKNLTAEEVYYGAQDRGMAWAMVRSPDEALHDPHWEDRGFFVKTYHADLGREIRYPGAPYTMSESPWSLRRIAPKIGEHTVEVLHGELGIPKNKLVQMFEAGVI